MLLKGEKYAVQALNLNVVAAFREISLQNLRNLPRLTANPEERIG